MNDIAAPTCADLADEDDGEPGEGYERVSRHSDNSWRHGTRETWVFHRKADDTYWQAHFRLSTDGETHELREGLAGIMRVYPHQVTVIQYSPVPA